jgi:predicted Zn-dependent peptidase
LNYFDDVGTLTISAGLDAGNLAETLKLIHRQMELLTRTIPGEAEFRRARDYVLGQIDLGLESTDNQMMWLGEQLFGYGHILPPAEIKRRLAKVRPSEIRAAARDFFRPERLNLALVSSLKSERGLVRMLAKGR